MNEEEARALAEAVRKACIEAARRGYAEASESGICHEGAVEASLDAIQMLDLKALREAAKKPG